ncbi:related to GSG1 - sporulation specific protein [Cephalotrichum gorgonifer]|uniref:Related to GSG1 - sporulation specific protein n=1 Tax=Cephalotrichum gorgonifer TaxID=2041049 RepID=A0AAE8SVW1_9PEZI|nr:related to GSG1 - sporulation specific protein [Cephalotrichum gorgonifer]
MQPNDDGSVAQSIQSLPLAVSAKRSPNTTNTKKFATNISDLPSSPHSTFPSKRSRRSTPSLFASTSTPPGSRSISPAGSRPPSRAVSGAGLDRGTPGYAGDRMTDDPGAPINLIRQSFVPHVCVLASEDTDVLIREKGFEAGLWELLRPFGDRIHGKVTIRDSNGASRSCEDFSIRFVRLGEDVELPDSTASASRLGQANNGAVPSATKSNSRLRDAEAVVARHLQYAEESSHGLPYQESLNRQGSGADASSPYYSLFLRRLLSGIPLAPHATFAHPVACVIAISSRNKNPIEELRRLYEETSQGKKKLPAWVDGEYLRYYVLIHDEEHDDITRSMSLFEQMKRHLGLHCHLLRLRSTQCAETDDDSIVLPKSAWITSTEELEAISQSETDNDFVDTPTYIFEPDATAIRTFIREMVIQSVIPTMERNVAMWNENVASRRRGITGRLVTFSRRWAGFSGTSKSSSSPGSGTSNDYNMLGFYRPETPEGTLRKLADFAFMLRDYKLAHSTYDLIRADFQEAKAWKHHAAANEMAAISLLMIPQHLTSKSRLETIGQMLEAAFYSYHSRCSDPCGALRSVALGAELLKLRGDLCIDDAARWGIRLIDSKIPGLVADALLKERVAAYYAAKQGMGSHPYGRRRRKAAIWNVLGAEAWVAQDILLQAQRCLDDAQTVYSGEAGEGSISKFTSAKDFTDRLQQHLTERLESTRMNGGIDSGAGTPVQEVDEESEALDLPIRRARGNTLTSAAAGTTTLETAPLRDAVEPGTGEETFNGGQAQGGFD